MDMSKKMNSLDDFIKSIPEDLETIIEKVRYLYLELGKRSYYDPEYKYYMFGEEEQYGSYSNKSYINPNIIICTTLAKQFANLLKMAGIDAEIVHDDDHLLDGFYDENGNYHLADITNDLKNIQFGCKTSYFGKETIDQSKIRDIDLKLGYITEKRSYIDEYWYLVKEAVKDSKLSDKAKLEFVLHNLQKYGDVTKPGDTEIFQIYQKYLRYCLPDTLGISFYSTKTSKYSKEKNVVQLREGEEITKYVLNPETRLFEEQKQEKKENSSHSRDER